MLFDEEVKKKLEDGGIKFETVSLEVSSLEGDSGTIENEFAIYPSGRNTLNLKYSNRIPKDSYLKSSIEKYKFIRDFEAIWSPEFGAIECELKSTNRFGFPSSFIFQRFHRLFDTEIEEDNQYKRFDFNPSENGLIISIGGATDDFSILSSLKNNLFRFDINRKRPTLRIENLNIERHDHARSILNKVGNSILFKLDITSNLALTLSEDRIRNRFSFKRKKEVELDKEFPQYEYDNEPMSLYWYAKSAIDMPLLQFLAFYQILEFYYPIYSQRDAHQKIKNIIKDPRFNPNKDSDISTIITSIKQNKNQLGFGSELEQLKATLTNCLSNDELKELIELNDEIKLYYGEKDSKKLASKSISLNNMSNLIIDFAERLYEIRCRIVHTKVSEKDYKLLIPSSPELHFMIYEIVILEEIVKKVLISSSRAINL